MSTDPDSPFLRRLAVRTRDALELLGWETPVRCLPGEPDAARCGGDCLMHAFANLAALKAVVDHRLSHMSYDPGAYAEIYEAISRQLRAECTAQHN